MYFSPNVSSALLLSALLTSHGYAKDADDLFALTEQDLRAETGGYTIPT